MAEEKVSYSLTPKRIKQTLASLEDASPEVRESHAWLEDYADSGIPFEGVYDFGSNLEGAVEKFGDQVVYNYCKQAVGLWLGGRVRDMLQAGKSAEEIQEIISNPNYKPGLVTRAPRKDKGEAYLETIQKKAADMTPEEREAEMQRLQEMMDLLS